MVLCALLLSSCSPDFSSSSSSDYDTAPPASSNPAAPPDASSRPLLPGQVDSPKTPDGLPALMPERALKYDRLFTEDIQDPAVRVRRVENAVMDLRHDFEAVLPTIVHLAAIEKDMQQLTEQLGTLLPNEPRNAAVSNASMAVPPEEPGSSAAMLGAGSPVIPAVTTPPPAPQAQAERAAEAPQAAAALPPAQKEQVPKTAPPPPQQAAPETAPETTSAAPQPPPVAPPPPETEAAAQAPPVQLAPPTQALPAPPPPAAPKAAGTGGVRVERVRLGEQPGGKIRMVLDLTGKADYRFDIDNEEKLLLVELPKTGWSGETGRTLAGNPLIQSYDVQKTDSGGSRMIVTLRKGAKVTYNSLLLPAGGSGYRVVLDLQAAP
jgi:hypothetical protein